IKKVLCELVILLNLNEYYSMNTNLSLIIRPFALTDIREIIDLFHSTVTTIGARYYSPQQITTWSTNTNHTHWEKKLCNTISFVATNEQGLIVGFANITNEGYFDHLYVHKDYQGYGVAYALHKQI